MCGSIRAYQYGRIDAFEAHHNGQVTTTEEAYVAGVSLTHGSPRQHIWPFVAATVTTETQSQMVKDVHATVLQSPSHHLWEETISVNQESTQVPLMVFIQMILSGMVKAAVVAVAVAHSTIRHTSLSNSLALPLTL